MLKKVLSWFGPGLLSKIASPGQLSSIARSILKVLGASLLTMGYSDAVVNGFVDAATPIVAGLLSLAIGFVASFFSEKLAKAK